MSLALLATLALLDATLSAYRDAAGRNARIDKRRYYLVASLFGLGWGTLGLSLLSGLAWVLWSRRPELASDMLGCATAMAWAFAPFAALVSLALLVWLVGTSRVRTLLSLTLLGPLTMFRHILVALGLAVGCYAAHTWETAGLVVLGGVWIGSAERCFAAGRRLRGGRLWPGEPGPLA